jgi:hypothetical protein
MHLALALALALAAESYVPPEPGLPASAMPAATPDDGARVRLRFEFLDAGLVFFDAISEQGSLGSAPAVSAGGLAAGLGLFLRYRRVEAGLAAASTLNVFGPNRAQMSLLAGVSVPLGDGPSPRCRAELLGELGRASVSGIGSSPFFGPVGGAAPATLYYAGARAGVSVRFNPTGVGFVLGAGTTVTHDLGTVTTSSDQASYRVGGLLASIYLRLGVET